MTNHPLDADEQKHADGIALPAPLVAAFEAPRTADNLAKVEACRDDQCHGAHGACSLIDDSARRSGIGAWWRAICVEDHPQHGLGRSRCGQHALVGLQLARARATARTIVPVLRSSAV